jgi:hypothetical protein
MINLWHMQHGALTDAYDLQGTAHYVLQSQARDKAQ